MSNAVRAITAHTFIGDFGQMVDSLLIECTASLPVVDATDFELKNGYTNCTATLPSRSVVQVMAQQNTLTLQVDPFLYRADFSIEGRGNAQGFSFGKADIGKVIVQDADLFTEEEKCGVTYRLYEPEAYGPRPLVLFLHGGGECGSDNLWQLTGTLGAIKLAKRLPDMYVMAPQAPDGGLTVEEMLAQMAAHGDPFKVDIGADTDSGKGDRGWNRDYLGRVCDCIRGLIAQGKVDGSRVYVIGMSMGGAGVLKALSVAPELFAAAVPICPSMNGETYPILENLPNVPVYLATAYIDHQAARHAYILRACKKLWAAGRRDVEYTIFTPEELETYGIVAQPGLTERQIREANHNSWVLVLHNEYGILDWMLAHRKDG